MTQHLDMGIGFSTDFVIRSEALGRLEARLKETPPDVSAALAGYQPASDEFQKKVIDSTAEVIRVVAPAGSGKTQTIVNRLLSRVKAGDRPDRLLCLTFDRSAASALRDKLAGELRKLPSQPNIDQLEISTLNAYGYKLLREKFADHYKRIPNNDGLRYSKLKACQDSLKHFSPEHASALPNLDRRFYLDFFSLLKNELHDPRALEMQTFADYVLESRAADVLFDTDLSEVAVTHIVQAVAWLFQSLDKSMDSSGFMDFDDQKLRAYQCLRENPSVLAALQGALTEVVVDEFQDINRLDFVLVKDLAARSRLLVVGDDDQAIYGFRGCSPEYIINLEKHLGRPVASYTLSINYRCPPNIVDHSDRLIRHNRVRLDKTPIAARTDPSEIKVISAVSAGLEAKACVMHVQEVLSGNPALTYRDIAILYRTNAQNLPVQIEFILNEIPFNVRKEDNIVNNEVLPRLLEVLRGKAALSANRRPSASQAAEIVCGYFMSVSATQRKAVEDVAGAIRFEDLARADELFEVLPKARNSRLAEAVTALASSQGLTDTLAVVGSHFRGLRGLVGSLEDAVDNRVPLGELAEVAANFGGTLEDFIGLMSRALRRAQEMNAGTDEEGVGLLTYFKSKGLQWHSVILTSCNEGLIPHSRAVEDEERRLFYVAMTRASANLYISYLASTIGSMVTPSRFLGEAGLL